MTSKKTTSYNDMRSEILRRRYLRKDREGKIVETEKEMFRRVADAVAAVEFQYGATNERIETVADTFYELMTTGKFLPNSPTLMNAGRSKGLLSACFVLPVEDSINGIFDAVKNTALIQKEGGGTGFDFSSLRPTGDIVASSGGKTSGPMSFMRVFAEATQAIQQGAFRRGANMGMMSVDHPDILRFIHAKRNSGSLTNFNVSVKVPDAFMSQLKKNLDAPHIVVNPRTKRRYVVPHSVIIETYTIDDLIPADQATADCLAVGEIWRMIVTNAHATGEPGICFIDRVNRDNPTPLLGEIQATNPCGEQPLLPYEACNLGSIDVSKFVLPNRTDIDWPHLSKVVADAVRFLDNVIDANSWPLPEIKETTLGNRKIGLGVMGFSDALILLGIRYDSENAVNIAKELTKFTQKHAHTTSQQLAGTRGCFPNWEGSVWDTKHHRSIRNVGITTIAPTGTISLIAGCSSGIEPVFSLATKRRIMDDQEFIQLHPLLENLGTKEGWLTDRVRNQLVEGIPPSEIREMPKELSEVLVTAHEVSPEWHVKIQAVFQEHTDNAVSKTVNLPADATIEDIDKVYHWAFKLGTKGTTVYRDGCHENQVITPTSRLSDGPQQQPNLRPRVRTATGSTTKFRMGCGTLFVTVNKDERGLCEVFANLGKAGGCPAQSEATCRAISAALRCGVEPGVLIEQLKGIRCLSTIARRKDNNDINILSCPDAIAKAIVEALGQHPNPRGYYPINGCPECGRPLRRETGCNVCDSCGYSKCG